MVRLAQWDLAIGGGGGYTHEDPGFDMAYTRPELRVIWKPTQQLSFDGQGGVQESSFLGGDHGHSGTAIFSADLNYQPRETTKLTAGANRSVAPSLFSNQVTESNSYEVNVSQRLLTHYYLSVGASTGKSNYLMAGSALTVVRGDTTNSLTASLTTVILRRVNLALNASQVHNGSSTQGYGFTSGQYGFSIALKY